MSYTAARLSEVLGVTRQAVQKRSKKERWPHVKSGKAKSFALGNLPQDVRDAVLAWELKASTPAVAETPQPPAITAPVDTSLLTTKQRGVMCARLAFVREIDRLAATGLAKTVIMDNLVEASRRGELAKHLVPMVVMANDRSGGERGLSKRSLQRWCSDFAKGGEGALAPARTGKDLGVPAWAADFLAVYQRHTNPSLADSYRQVFGLPHRPNPGAPSIHAVRRFVSKLSLPAKEQGRRTGNAMLHILPHKKLDTSQLWPTDIYTMDGTTFDAEIQHPHTGNPFKPEITLVVDVATRRCVGISVALSESAISTLAAIRMACLYGGIPAMLHADNGPGYGNAVWTAEGTGMMARLGTELTPSIPGRPQGKGLMERAIQTICVSASKRLPSCMHDSVDQDAMKKMYKISRQALRAGGNALPTWDEFRTVILQRWDEYNNTPHRGAGMPKIVDEISGRWRPMTPNEAWNAGLAKGFEPVTVPDNLREELFMPAAHRRVRNGKVQFLNGEYSHKDLEEMHLEMVEVRYDFWDSSKVYVFGTNGVKICTAELDAHAVAYRPKARIEVADERRRKGQLKRLQAKVQRIDSGAVISLPEAGSTMYSDELVIGRAVSEPIDVEPIPTPKIQGRPLFLSGDHHYRWLMEHRDQCTEADEAWLERYAQGPDYADMADRYAFEKIAYAGTMAQAKEASR